MLKFPNFHLKIHHDTSFKWKSVEHESCSSWSNLSKKSKFIHFGQELLGMRMAWTWYHHLAKIKLQIFTHTCLAIQVDFRPSHTHFWTLSNDLMGLYMPMHPCIIICQFWKVNLKVQISWAATINRALWHQNSTYIRASFDPKPLTLPFERINIRISSWNWVWISLFWDSKLQGSKAFCAFHSTPACILSKIKHGPRQEQLNPDLHWRYFPKKFISSILSQSYSTLLILWLSEVLPM